MGQHFHLQARRMQEMIGFHELLKYKPSSLLNLRSKFLSLEKRMLVSRDWMLFSLIDALLRHDK
jgi:hypothetical protein